MKSGNLPGAVAGVADVVVSDNGAVCRVEERDTIRTEPEEIGAGPSGIALCLNQDILGAEREFLGLDNPEYPAADTEGIVSGAVVGGVFNDGAPVIRCERFGRFKGDDLPAGGCQCGIDQRATGLPFGVCGISRSTACHLRQLSQ